MDLSPKDFLKGRDEPAAWMLAEAGYPRCQLDGFQDWSRVHEWCSEHFDGYTWTGSLFWFQYESDALFFRQVCNLELHKLKDRGYSHAIVFITPQAPVAQLTRPSPAPTPESIREIIDRLAEGGVSVGFEDFGAQAIGIYDEKTAAKAALLGFEVFDIRHLDSNVRPDPQ